MNGDHWLHSLHCGRQSASSLLTFFFSRLLYSYISRILSSLARQTCCHKLNFPYILIHNRRTTLHHILRLSQINGCVHPHVHPTLHSPAETS